MPTHPKKPSMDNRTDKSDILSILESIETMFEVYQKVLNIYTQTSLMLSMTTEAEMLILKLQVMQERWEIHPPFKEAISVNFYEWSRKIENMAKAIGGVEASGDEGFSIDEYCPSKHYLLDLYECLDESPSHNGSLPYYAESNVTKFIAEQTRMRNKLARKWKEYQSQLSDLVPKELEEHLGGVYKPLAEGGVTIKMTCHTVLRDLSVALYNLYDTTHVRMNGDQFARLAERVFEEEDYGGSQVKSNVEHEVNELKNSTPEDQWEARREEELRVSIDLVKYLKLESKVFNYLGRDKTMLDNPAGMGRFLWSVRHNISRSDLNNLFELLYRIAYLSKDRELQTVVEQSATPEQPQPEPKDAEGVYRKRKATTLQKPSLPKFFNEKLASNETAVDCFYETLHHCGFYIGRTLLPTEKKDAEQRCYEGWKWNHLREAFIRLDFFKADSSKKGFAEYLADVFPYLSATNIQRGFNSRGGYVDTNATRRIIQEMVNEFEDVVDVMKIVSKN